MQTNCLHRPPRFGGGDIMRAGGEFVGEGCA